MSSTRDGNLGFGLTNFVQVLEEIDKALDERYVFPSEDRPWKTKYWTANNDVSSTCIYDDCIVPHRTRMYRTMWLLNKAHSMLVERRYILATSYSTHPPVMTQL